MANTFTPNKNLIKPEPTGDDNAWGEHVNETIDDIDSLFGDKEIINDAGGTVVLTEDEQLSVAIEATGALTSNLILQFNKKGVWFVRNATTNAFSLTVQVSGQTTPPTIPQGTSAMVFSDGTNARVATNATAFAQTLLDDADADAALTTLGVSTFAKTLLDDASATALLATLGIVASTYTPTLTNTTNIASSNPVVTNYLRIGNIVHVGGQFTADVTAAGLTVLEMSLPVASDFVGQELGGVGVSPNSSGVEVARIIGDLTNNTAAIRWFAINTGSQLWAFTFTYRVV